MDLEVQEAILAEELERVLHPPDGRDLSVELDKAHARAVGCEDFWCPGRHGHAARPEHSLTPEVSSGILAGGRPHLAALARSAGLRRWSMGLSFGMAAAPVTLGHSPRRSFTLFSLFYFAPQNGHKIRVNIYARTHTHRYFIRMMENLCCCTPEPPCP
jgi:hypothetical protein